MTTKFFASVFSVSVLALALTPELTNALAFLIAAIFVGLVNLYIARTARLVAVQETRAIIAPVAAKIDALVPVVAKIDGHVNSEKTKADADSAAQKMQIELQRETIDELKKAAALLAQAKATSDMSKTIAQAAVAGATTPPAPAPASAPATRDHLDKIETNTAETAANTKRTDEIVTDALEHKPRP